MKISVCVNISLNRDAVARPRAHLQYRTFGKEHCNVNLVITKKKTSQIERDGFIIGVGVEMCQRDCVEFRVREEINIIN